MEQGKIAALLKEWRGRWVLVAGGRLSTSSGVPLPTRRTRWSPSLTDLVQHHIFRTQSREIFVNVEEAIQSGQPPLGFVADSLEGQQKWLDTVLAGLTPHTPVLRLADLAKAGHFRAILTDAFDGLLLRALSRVGVACKEISITSPGYGEEKALPVLREWDDRAFLDTQDHRSRENEFVRARLAEMIDERSAILVVGQHAQWSDLNRALVDALKRFPALPVLWIEEPLGAEETPVTDWMAEHLGAFTHVKVPSLPEYVEGLSSELGVEKTPLVAPPPAKETLFQRVMSTSFDVKPVLVFVPGVALLGGLLNQLPKMTVGKALSLLALAAVLAGFMNYRERRAYFQQVDPVLDRVTAAQQLLKTSAEIQGVNRAEALIRQAEAEMTKVNVPAKSSFTFDTLRDLLVAHRARAEGEVNKVRDSEITPRLFLYHQRSKIESDPAQEAMGTRPPLQVHEVSAAALGAEAGTDPRGIYFQGKPLAEHRVLKRLDAYRGENRLALLSPSALLLQVTLRQEILEDSKVGRIAVEVDLSKGDGGPLESKILDAVRDVAGYTGERAALFRPAGIRALFQEGKCSFYFTHLDGAGVAGSVAKIDSLLAQYPRCRAVLSASTRGGEVQLSRVAPSYRFLSVARYPWPTALAYLREHTSPSFAENVVENNLLRWNLAEPLVLSLLVDRYRVIGSAPRSLAAIHDRLLSLLLARGGPSAPEKRAILGALAHERLRTGHAIDRRKAAEIVGKADNGLLERLVDDGVLRSLGDVQIDFVDQQMLSLCAAAHASKLPPGERLSFLLRGGDDLLAFHAGLDPRASELAGHILAEFDEVDGLLRKRNKHLELLNPRLLLLRKAAWVVQNGEVDPNHARHLESLLFEMTRHRDARVVSEAILALSTLSTPAVRRWVLDGIEQDAPQDEQLLQIAARAPSDVYVGAIRRWYRRLATDADRKKSERFKEGGGDAEGEFRSSEAVANAFSALAQSGTEDSLGFLSELAASGEDPRFTPDIARSFRQHAVRILLANGHHDLVRPVLPAISQAPNHWLALLPELYRLNDAPVVKALVDILKTPLEEKAASKDAREYAAFALSRVDRGLAVPALAELLRQRREGPPDALPYAALSLGYRGEPADLPLVAAFAEDVHKRRKERPVTAEYTATLERALALFSSAESFALFTRLAVDPDGWGSSPSHFSVLPFFKGVGAETFALRRLLCESLSPPEESALVQALGRMRTPGARQALDGLLRAVDGLETPKTLGSLCGDDGSKARQVLRAWTPARRRGISLALVQLQDERDLPRLLRWATDPEQDVRRAALEALGRVRGDGLVVAREALAESLVRHPEDRVHAIRALGSLGSLEAEGPLLSLLGAPDARSDWLVPALEKVGGWESFLRLYAMQGKGSTGLGAAPPGAIASAVFRIASRMVGEPLGVERFSREIPR